MQYLFIVSYYIKILIICKYREATNCTEYAKNQAKWKAATEYCEDRLWEFKVMTEKELGIK